MIEFVNFSLKQIFFFWIPNNIRNAFFSGLRNDVAVLGFCTFAIQHSGA